MIRFFIQQGAPVRAAHLAAMCAATVAFSGAGSVAFAFGAKPQSAPVITDPTLARAAQTARPDSRGWTTVIVQIAPGANAQAVEKAVAQLGGDITRHLPIIQSFAVRVPTKNLNALAQTPGIAHISRDVQTKRHADEFTVQHTGADVATTPGLLGGYGLYGSGVTVAVLDSGIHPGKDFENSGLLLKGSRIIGAVNLSGSDGTDDKLGHGTHVAGIIAGNGTNSTGLQYYRTFLGVAPSASLVNVRVLDKNGSGTVSNVIAGLNWIVQNKAKYNIRVVNVSLGHPVYESVTTDPLNLAVQAAWKAGIVVVCSAGNTGRMGDVAGAYPGDNEGYGTQYGTVQCPGNDPLVITVGAMKNVDTNRANDKIATYSSRGPSRLDMVIKPDLVAPGNRVISVCADGSTLDNAFGGSNDIKLSTYQNTTKNDLSKTYYVLSGTSMAAPVVSGAVALLLNKNSNLSPDTIKARLMLSADKWENDNGTPDVLTYGAGFLNIPAALDNTKVVPATSYAVSPFLIVASDGTMKVDMNQALWGKASLWETGVVSLQTLWGTDAIIGLSTVWGDQALWGKASAVRADQALWGRATASSVDISSASVYGEQ